ncbi:hypothetical protein BDZ97DRAFT_1903508 [Flammula alnicola]|nr:hypothetical protein BDZ97DRAFT_1903508 [Flammula alnicola]
MTKASKSPERLSRYSRFKPSTPIEIPICRRPAASSSPSPDGHPASPDMLFEMSPVSSNSPPLSSVYPTSRSNEINNHEPFMYHVPTFRPCPAGPGTGTQLRRKFSRQRVMPSRHDSGTIPLAAELAEARHTKSYTLPRSEDVHATFPQHQHRGMEQTPSTTKITGFSPINDHHPLAFDQPSRPTIPLNPPPRRSSYSSLPWILPGKSDRYEDDVSYSQVDPSAFEFRRHLLRRIEHQDPSRFKSLHSQCF